MGFLKKGKALYFQHHLVEVEAQIAKTKVVVVSVKTRGLLAKDKIKSGISVCLIVTVVIFQLLRNYDLASPGSRDFPFSREECLNGPQSG